MIDNEQFVEEIYKAIKENNLSKEEFKSMINKFYEDSYDIGYEQGYEDGEEAGYNQFDIDA